MCRCRYSVATINAGTLADEYDHITWVPGTGSKSASPRDRGLGRRRESIDYYHGDITLATKDNTYDLEVSETFIEGMVGDEVTVTTVIGTTVRPEAPT